MPGFGNTSRRPALPVVEGQRDRLQAAPTRSVVAHRTPHSPRSNASNALVTQGQRPASLLAHATVIAP